MLTGQYLLNLVVIGTIALMVCAAIRPMTVRSGIWAVCWPAFAGLGAYGFVFFAQGAGLDPWLAAGAAVAVAVVLALVLWVPIGRLTGDSLLLALFVVQLVFEWGASLPGAPTRGSRGIAGFAGVLDRSNGDLLLSFAVTTAAICASILFLEVWVAGRNFGTVLRTARDAEPLGRSLRVPLGSARALSWLVVATGSALAGILQARYAGFVYPGAFAGAGALGVLAATLLGGDRGFVKLLIAGPLVAVGPELLRLAGASGHSAAEWRNLGFGAALVAISLLRVKAEDHAQ